MTIFLYKKDILWLSNDTKGKYNKLKKITLKLVFKIIMLGIFRILFKKSRCILLSYCEYKNKTIMILTVISDRIFFIYNRFGIGKKVIKHVRIFKPTH